MVSMDFILALIFGIAFGIVLQKTGFCMTTAFAEAFAAKDYRSLKAWLLIILISMIGFYLAWQVGVVEKVWRVPLRGSGMFNLVGTFLFGIGMVLAGGCAVGTLHKIGEGQVASILALIGIFLGAYLYLAFGAPALSDYYTHQKITLPEMLGINPWILVAIALAIGFGILAFKK
jgi:hypothetical protein